MKNLKALASEGLIFLYDEERRIFNVYEYSNDEVGKWYDTMPLKNEEEFNEELVKKYSTKN